MNFILASNNKNKLKEMKEILSPLGIDVKTAQECSISLDDVEETGTTFEENAILKAMSAYKLTGMPAIADDSGLVVDALNGEPGVYSARYSGEDANDKKNIDKLLNKMSDTPEENRGAHFVCTICCIISQEEKIIVTGECYGKIGHKTCGNNGFGYDPVFIAKDGRTFAEMTDDEKNKISHRGNALRKLAKELEKKFGGSKC